MSTNEEAGAVPTNTTAGIPETPKIINSKVNLFKRVKQIIKDKKNNNA